MADANDKTRKLTAARVQYQANRKYLLDRREALYKVAGLSPALQEPYIFRRFSWVAAEKEDAIRFRPQFVEPLLQQASGLVDRVLAEDPLYRQLRTDQLNLRLDLQELEALQDINDDEVAAGLFKVPFWEASTALESDKALKQAQTDLAAWVAQNSDLQTKLAGWSTENAQLPLPTGWEGKLSQHQLRLFGGYSIPAGVAVPSGETATDGNFLGGVISYQIAGYNFAYLQQQLASQSKPIDARSVPLTSRVNYLQADEGFKERRKITAHQKLVDKLRSVQLQNGALNYADRIQAIEDRAAFDLREAYQRMRVLRRGLKVVYGIDAADLPEVPVKDDHTIGVDYLDRLVEWIRRTSIRLQDFYNNDQELMIPISLRDLLTHSGFHEGLKRGYWEFEVGRTRFQGLKLVRMRGISAVSQGHGRIYSLLAAAPKETEFSYGENLAAREVQHVDDCWLGQVMERRDQLRPDVWGARVLWNASPFGRWALRAAPGTTLDHLDDIQVTLNVAAQRIV
jgi:hypothetical protein